MGGNSIISVEIDLQTALLIRDQLKNMAMPPLDENDLAQNRLYNAIVEALEADDS